MKSNWANLEVWLVLLIFINYILATIALQMHPIVGLVGAAANTLVAAFYGNEKE